VTDAEMGLEADRAWQVEFGDRWREKKEECVASKARESQQLAEFVKGVARDVADMRATFHEMQATLAENARLREERERRLEEWAMEDAWARLRGGQ